MQYFETDMLVQLQNSHRLYSTFTAVALPIYATYIIHTGQLATAAPLSEHFNSSQIIPIHTGGEKHRDKSVVLHEKTFKIDSIIKSANGNGTQAHTNR